MKAKFLGLFAAFMVIATMLCMTASATGDVILGDVNDDAAFDDADVIVMSRYLTGWDGVTVNETNADFDEDGRITAWDLIMMERHLAGWFE